MKKLALLLLSVIVMSFTTDDRKIGGIEMPEILTKSGESLDLNGAGVRTKYFLKLYVGGLYLSSKSSNASEIISKDEAMAIRLHIISSMITSEKMESSTREGFKNSLGSKKHNLTGEIEMFIDIFKEEIKEDDIFEMFYIPGKGVEVYKNGKMASTIGGLEFKKALFGIWLGENPAQESLKEEMLALE